MSETPEEERMDEQTEPEDPETVNGIAGQLIYPDRRVDAERAAAHAAGKVDTLYPDEEDLTEINPDLTPQEQDVQRRRIEANERG